MFSNKKTIIGVVTCAILCAIAGSGEQIIGMQTAVAADGADTINSFVQNKAIWQVFALGLTYIMLSLNGILLDPELIFELNDPSFGGVLFSMWQISRDIMNTIFAFMLVLAALYTIVRADSTMIKERLAKFVLGVILVNFSWLFPRIIIDISTVAAASVYTLPASVGTVCKDADGADCKAVKAFWYDVKNTSSCPGSATASWPCECEPQASSRPDQFIIPAPGICVELQDITETNTSAGILNAIYVSHMRLIDLDKVAADGPAAAAFDVTSGVTAGKISFIMNLLFALIFTVAILFPLLALAAVLLVRIPIIWVTICFMPFMFIGFIAGDQLGGFDTMKIFKEFMKAAFIPAVVGIPLVVGYIMLNQAGPGAIPCDPNSIMGRNGFCTENDGLLNGFRTFYEILWGFISLAIIWLGVFGSLSNMGGVYAKIGSKLDSVGKSWGKFALKAPLATGLIPGPGDTRLDANSFDRINRAIQDPNAALSAAGGRLDSGTLGRIIGGNSSANPVQNFDINSSVANNIKQTINNNSLLNAAQLEDIKKALTGQGITDKGQAREVLLNRLNLNQQKVDDVINKIDLPPAPST